MWAADWRKSCRTHPRHRGDGQGPCRRTTTDVIEPLPLNLARSTGIGLDEPGHTTIPPGDTQICHILPAPRCSERDPLVTFPSASVEFPLPSAKRAVEDRLRQSRMEYTILQPTFFSNIWLGPALGYSSVRQQGFGV